MTYTVSSGTLNSTIPYLINDITNCVNGISATRTLFESKLRITTKKEGLKSIQNTMPLKSSQDKDLLRKYLIFGIGTK